MDEATDLATVVGAATRRERSRLHLTQDDVASSMRGFGWTWDRSTVSKVEAGTRDLDARELICLAVALDVGLPVLLTAASPVRCAPRLDLSSATVAKVLNGTGPLDLRADEIDSPSLDPVEIAARFVDQAPSRQALADHVAEVLARKPSAVVLTRAATSAHQQAEQTTAKRLGYSPIQIAAIAQTLWKHSLTDEVATRLADRLDVEATDDERRAVRGHISRQLDGEIREYLHEIGVRTP